MAAVGLERTPVAADQAADLALKRVPLCLLGDELIDRDDQRRVADDPGLAVDDVGQIGAAPLTPTEIEWLLSLASAAAHGTGDRTTAPLRSTRPGAASPSSLPRPSPAPATVSCPAYATRTLGGVVGVATSRWVIRQVGVGGKAQVDEPAHEQEGVLARRKAPGGTDARGSSAIEVGKEIGEHADHGREHGGDGRGARLISVSGAVLLSVVTIVAAWSGYSAAKWGTESSLKLAKASAIRTKANRAFQESLTFRTADGILFNSWFAAYLTHNPNGMRLAEKRFRPEYRVAFDAWLATHPFTNPDAPAGPQEMPQYIPTGEAQSRVLDASADAYYAEGQKAAETGDEYVRVTVILASVLFLVGLSTQFPLLGVRFAMIGVGAGLLMFAGALILTLPGPP